MAETPNKPRRSTRQVSGGDEPVRRSTRPQVMRSTRQPPVVKRKRLDAFKLVAMMFLLIGASLLLYQPVINNWVGPAQLDKAYANNMSADDLENNLMRYQSILDGDGDGDEDEASPGEASSPDASEIDFERGTDQEEAAKREAIEAEVNALFDPASIQTIETLAVNPKFNKNNVIGGVYAPSVGMMMPIMYGMSQEILLTSAGTMKRTMTMGEGNYALIGHHARNPKALFAPTHRLEPGHVVYITDKKRVYSYEVVVNTVVSPKDVYVINDVPGRSLLTMISCTDDSKNRVVIQAELIESVPYAESGDAVIKAFNDL